MQKKNNCRNLILGCCMAGIAMFLAFFFLYQTYIRNIIYEERLNQMEEITRQMFQNLEDVIDSHWDRVAEECNYLGDANVQTTEELCRHMKKKYELSAYADHKITLMAMDSEGGYYTESGNRGLFRDLDYFEESPEKISFVFDSMTDNRSEMVFLDVYKRQIVESALHQCAIIEDMGYDNLVISIKSSNVLMCAKAHELLAQKTDHPLHVGITEAGTLYSGNIKSAIGLGIILYQGIGDTIRVSLTGDPLEEVRSAKMILKTLGLRKGGIEVVSCPTCGRTQIDLIGLANQVQAMVEDIPLDIKVAVMGCVVNGPGEAKEADIGIAGGKGEGLLIKKGEVVRKMPEEELLPTLREELLNWKSVK